MPHTASLNKPLALQKKTKTTENIKTTKKPANFSPGLEITFENTMKTLALLDSGSNHTLMSSTLAQTLNLKKKPLDQPISLVAFDGRREVASYSVTAAFTTGPSVKFPPVEFLVMDSTHIPVILGYSWLESMNPHLDWKNKQMILHFENFEISMNLENLRNIDPGYVPKDTSNLASDNIPPVASVAAVPPFQSPRCAFDQDKSAKSSPNAEPNLKELPIEYHEFSDVFSKYTTTELPPHRDCINSQNPSKKL